jgi:hypothetical protein
VSSNSEVRFLFIALNIEMMERSEIIELLRETLSIEIEMSDSCECESHYITSTVTLRLDGEVIMSDDSTVNID